MPRGTEVRIQIRVVGLEAPGVSVDAGTRCYSGEINAVVRDTSVPKTNGNIDYLGVTDHVGLRSPRLLFPYVLSHRWCTVGGVPVVHSGNGRNTESKSEKCCVSLCGVCICETLSVCVSLYLCVGCEGVCVCACGTTCFS